MNNTFKQDSNIFLLLDEDFRSKVVKHKVVRKDAGKPVARVAKQAEAAQVRNAVPKQDRKLYYASKIKELKPTDFNLNSKVYYYVKNIFMDPEKNDHEIINEVPKIGCTKIDKLILTTNLFFFAVRKDKINIMQEIINRVNDSDRLTIVNAYDHNYTPIMHAAYNGQVGAVKLLLIWGADKNVINKEGEDLFKCIETGMELAINKNKSLEILIKDRYDEIYNFIINWESTDKPSKLDPVDKKPAAIPDNLEECIIEYIDEGKFEDFMKLVESIKLLLSDRSDIREILNKLQESIEDEMPKIHEYLLENQMY